jgi:hypothetical protein
MATIAELIIAARVDPAGIAVGLGEGTRMLENYGQEAATVINAAIGSFDRLGKTIDVTNDAAVLGFRAQGDQLAANLVALGATDTELNKIGTSIARVERAAGAAAVEFAALHAEAVAMDREMERAAAASMAFQASARSRGASGILGALGGSVADLRDVRTETAALGGASRSTVIGISELARGIGQVGMSGRITALSMREFTGAAFRLGATLGEWGAIIGIVGSVGYAIYEMLSKTSKAMEDTRKKFAEELSGMMDDFDQIGLQKKLREVEIGKPSAGVGEGGGYTGSLRDLQARMDDAIAQYKLADQTWNVKLANTAKANIKSLAPQLEEAIRERDKILSALYNPQVLPGMERDITGLAKFGININSPLKQAAEDAKEAAKQMKALNEETAKLARFLQGSGGTAPGYGGMGSITGGATHFAFPIVVTPGAQLPIPQAPPATMPDVGGMSDLRLRIQPVIDAFKDAASLVGNSMMSAFGPVALLFKVMEPAIRIISTLFDKLLAPLTAVVEVIAAGLEPVFRLLFPIIRDVAIALTYLQEILDRVVSAIARLVGNVVTAIGALIAHIPFLGSWGHAIENAGKSLLTYAAGLTDSANEMAQVRKRLEAMQFGQTADSIAQLGDAAAAAAEQLNNVPQGFKATLDYLTYLVQTPQPMNYGGYAGALAGGGSGTVINGDVYVDARTKSIPQAFDELKTEAQIRARSLTGDVSKASDVWNH